MTAGSFFTKSDATLMERRLYLPAVLGPVRLSHARIAVIAPQTQPPGKTVSHARLPSNRLEVANAPLTRAQDGPSRRCQRHDYRPLRALVGSALVAVLDGARTQEGARRHAARQTGRGNRQP